DALALALFLTRRHTVGEHDAAERAARRDLGGIRGERFVDTVDVDALTDLLLHPHAGTTGTTAHGPLAVTRHLDELRARRRHQLTRSVVDLVVPSEEARVVVGHVLADGLDLDQLLRPHETVEQLRVVDDLVAATHLRVLVVQRVEAVRTGHDDLALALLDTLEHTVEDLDVL